MNQSYQELVSFAVSVGGMICHDEDNIYIKILALGGNMTDNYDELKNIVSEYSSMLDIYEVFDMWADCSKQIIEVRKR